MRWLGPIVAVTSTIETSGPPGTLATSGTVVGELGAEAARVGEHFAGERELRVHRVQAVGVEQHDQVAVRGWAGDRLDFGDLVAGAGAERHFHERAAVAEAGVRRAAGEPLREQRRGLADREAERGVV